MYRRDLRPFLPMLNRKKYTFLGPIGAGGCAEIYLIKSEKYGSNFALKHIHIDDMVVCERCELEALKCLSSVHVIQMFDFEIEPDSIYLILEYCPRGSLHDYIRTNGPQTGIRLLAITKTLLTGLQFIHSRRVAHSDIKPQNVLIDRYGRLKYADFGFARFFARKDRSDQFAGSINYMAPEILSRKAFDPFAADIWALGVVIFGVATGRTPWNSESANEVMERITSVTIDFGCDFPVELKEMVSMMMSKDPHRRPRCETLLEDPVFTGVDLKDGYLVEGRPHKMTNAETARMSVGHMIVGRKAIGLSGPNRHRGNPSLIRSGPRSTGHIPHLGM